MFLGVGVVEYFLLLLCVPFLFGDFFGGNNDDDGSDTNGPDIVGTEADDALQGTDLAEFITAGAGDDFVAAGLGDDTLPWATAATWRKARMATT